MAKCDICGKGAGYGHKVSHSKRHTNRRWMPNVHKKNITVGDTTARIAICTRCLRTMKKVGV